MSEEALPTLLPTLTGEQIAAMCARYSSAEVEVYAVVESINGHPVVHLARKCHDVRRQAG